MDMARLFLREEYSVIDPRLPEWLAVLRSVGASECFHKHGTFYQHLLEVYRILTLWGAPDAVARCGLFHSAYSNSYVNLAIFEPGVDRGRVRDLIGSSAEQLVHLFCIVPRQQLIHDMLLFKFSDEQLMAAAAGDRTRALLLPEGFITVKNIRTGEDLKLPRRLVAVFVMLTMADFADQLYNWQDKLFDNEDGTLDFHGNSYSALWPGDVKPGLWMSSISRMGLLLRALLKEDKQSEQPEFPITLPPVFDNCSKLLKPGDQIHSRDLYLEAVGAEMNETEMNETEMKQPEMRQTEMNQSEMKQTEMHQLNQTSLDSVASILAKACELNPWIGEPHLVLAQVHCLRGSFEQAESEAEEGLKHLLHWGTAWDKRVSWEAWIAWGRVLLMNAKKRTWPKASWGMINLGLVN